MVSHHNCNVPKTNCCMMPLIISASVIPLLLLLPISLAFTALLKDRNIRWTDSMSSCSSAAPVLDSSRSLSLCNRSVQVSGRDVASGCCLVFFSFGDLLSFTLTAFVELMDHGIVSWDTFTVAFIKKVRPHGYQWKSFQKLLALSMNGIKLLQG